MSAGKAARIRAISRDKWQRDQASRISGSLHDTKPRITGVYGRRLSLLSLSSPPIRHLSTAGISAAYTECPCLS